MTSFSTRFVLIAVLASFPACDTTSQESDTFEVTFSPPFVPTAIGPDVTNPYFPLPVGARWRYIGETEDGTEEIIIEVLPDTRRIAGIDARVVRDQVFLDGELAEDTFDWYGQDADGNVWYLGEETEEYENGEVVSTAGSWETGVDGAVAGIIMPGDPTVGQAYWQEFYEGEAEDRGRVLSTTAAVSVPAGSFTDCVQTEDTTALEPDVLEYKYYCAGVGTALEVDLEDDIRVELVEATLLEGS